MIHILQGEFAMQCLFKLRRLIFEEQGLVFAVQTAGKNDVLYFSAQELLVDDEKLASFSPMDVRLMIYFAAEEKFSLDLARFNQHHA